MNLFPSGFPERRKETRTIQMEKRCNNAAFFIEKKLFSYLMVQIDSLQPSSGQPQAGKDVEVQRMHLPQDIVVPTVAGREIG